MEVQYFPTLKCNLKCDYCVSHSNTEYTLVENRNTLLNIFRLFKEKNHGTLYIVGGEPSFHRNFLEMMKYIGILKKTIFPAKIELQTNLSLPKVYKEVINIVDYFSVSLHFIELKRKNRLKTFDNNFRLVKNKIYNLDIMLEHGTEQEMQEEKEYIKHLYSLNPKFNSSEMIYAYYGGYDNKITEEFKDFYEKYSKTKNQYFGLSTNELFAKKPNFKGYYCEAQANYYSILGNGEVYSCAGHYNEGLNGRKSLGNINIGFRKFVTDKPCICDYSDCCGAYYFHRSRESFNPEEYLDD